MACGICKKAGHDRRQCPILNKEKKAELELALTQRRFALEAIDSVTALLKVPMVTAGVWFMMSRSNATLGVLNKAILTAELAPIIGDIKFPEGVLLGAAIESTEDFVNLLSGEGLMDPWDKVYSDVEEKIQTLLPETLRDIIWPTKSCAELKAMENVLRLHIETVKRKVQAGETPAEALVVVQLRWTQVKAQLLAQCPGG